MGDDSNFVRAQVDVGIDPPALDAYLTDLKADADMASPSMQRGMALSQNRLSPMGPRDAIPCALTTRFRFGPVFYQPEEPQPPGEVAAHIPTNSALAILEEAINLLSVIDLHPVVRMSWVQPDDWLMAAGASFAWSSAGSKEQWTCRRPKSKPWVRHILPSSRRSELRGCVYHSIG
jgi:hypothetical protein